MALLQLAPPWRSVYRTVGGWAFQAEDGRDLRIDLLRGLAVLAMIIDHIAGPSRLYLLTGGNRFYTSAAEGFIFLSGLTVGLVYRRIAEEQGLATAMRRLLQRAWTLYVVALGLTLVMLPASEFLRLPWASGVETDTPLQIVWAIISLHQTYYLVDVLALYVLLMLVAPLALLLLSEGGTVVLLLFSWIIWAGFQFFPQQTELPWTTAGNNLFYLAAWQALFFTAMVLGFHRQRLGQLVRPAWRYLLLGATALGFVVLIVAYSNQSAVLEATQFALSHVPGVPPFSLADLEDALFAKGDVRPGRVVASMIVFAFLFQLTTLCWRPIRQALGWLLLPLGRNALYAYSTHVVLALALGVLGTQITFADNAVLNAAIQMVSIGLVWLAIRWRVLFPTPENRRVWMLSVVPLAVAAVVAFRLDAAPALDVASASAASTTQAASDSDALRHARAFGTPIPRIAGAQPGMQAPAAPATTPEPRPQPDTAANAFVPPQQAPSNSAQPIMPMVLSGTSTSADEFVGPIAGSFREMTFYSPSLDRDMSYYIYLPPGYGTEGRRYPVLYMLHGGGGDKDEWPAYGLIADADRSIQSKDLRPLIIVLPQGDLGYWVNWAGDGPRWGDYVTHDVRRQVDATFRTLPDASHRAIGGLSMGGAGALQLAFNHPEIFQVVGAHSPSLHVDDGTFSGIYGTGDDFAHREPIDLAANAPNIESLKIWVDAGEDDPWLERDEVLHANLDARGIAHNWNVFSGGHDGTYWTENIPAYLRFYDSVLNWETVS
jgi:enterochelin esterase-like enzyme